MARYEYGYEDIYDIVMALETIEMFIMGGKSNEALRVLKALKEGFKTTIYPNNPWDILDELKE